MWSGRGSLETSDANAEARAAEAEKAEVEVLEADEAEILLRKTASLASSANAAAPTTWMFGPTAVCVANEGGWAFRVTGGIGGAGGQETGSGEPLEGRRHMVPLCQLILGFLATSQSYPRAREQEESKQVARKWKRSEGRPGRVHSRSVYIEICPYGATEPSNSLSKRGNSKE